MMRGKHLNSTILALFLALVLIIPAFAEDETPPPMPEPDLGSSELVEDVQEPEEEPVPEEVQEEEDETAPEDVQGPDEGQEPEDVKEPDEGQEPEDDIQVPNEEQSPAEEEPEEEPEGPQEPEEEPGLEEEQVPEEEPDPEEDPLPEEEQVPEEEEIPEELEPDEPEDVVIEVTVPSSGQIIINPYHVRVDTGYDSTQEQIIHLPQALENRSEVPVSVHVRAVGTIPEGSEASFAGTPSLDAQSKEVFLYVEFQDDSGLWSEDYVGASNQLIITERGDFQENVLLLEAFGEGYFQLFGEMSDAPDPFWEPTDTFGAVLTFTFSAEPTVPKDEVSIEDLEAADGTQIDPAQ